MSSPEPPPCLMDGMDTDPGPLRRYRGRCAHHGPLAWHEDKDAAWDALADHLMPVIWAFLAGHPDAAGPPPWPPPPGSHWCPHC